MLKVKEENIHNNREITKLDFFIELAKLSYIGDFRTYVRAEKKDKVTNVVLGAFPLYEHIYKKYFEKYRINENNLLNIEIDMNIHKYEKFYDNLPENFKKGLAKYSKLTENQLKNTIFNDNKHLIENYIKHLNLKYSICAIISALYSTDIHKSVN